MTPKEKANELINKFLSNDDLRFEWDTQAKQCALIAVDEILELDNFSVEGREYWKEVKQEINNL